MWLSWLSRLRLRLERLRLRRLQLGLLCVVGTLPLVLIPAWGDGDGSYGRGLTAA